MKIEKKKLYVPQRKAPSPTLPQKWGRALGFEGSARFLFKGN